MHVLLNFTKKELKLGWIFDIVRQRSSMFFRVNQYFDYFVINAEQTTWHKFVSQNGSTMHGAISKWLESFLIPSQNPFNAFLWKIHYLSHPVQVMSVFCEWLILSNMISVELIHVITSLWPFMKLQENTWEDRHGETEFSLFKI